MWFRYVTYLINDSWRKLCLICQQGLESLCWIWTSIDGWITESPCRESNGSTGWRESNGSRTNLEPKLTNCVSALEVLKGLDGNVGENCPDGKFKWTTWWGLCALGGHWTMVLGGSQMFLKVQQVVKSWHILLIHIFTLLLKVKIHVFPQEYFKHISGETLQM